MSDFTNLGDLIRRERDLDKTALIDLGGEQPPREFSYRQLDEMANGVARKVERWPTLMMVGCQGRSRSMP